MCAVIYVSGILIHEKFLAIDFARKEIVGTTYTEVVRANLMGVFMVPAPVPAVCAASGLGSAGHRASNYDDILQTTDRSAQFAALQQGATGATDAQKTQLLDQGRVLLTTVGNQSNLILDPDLDSYYVMSLTLLRFPELLQILHDTRKFMQNRESTGQRPSPDGAVADPGRAAGCRAVGH